MYFSSLKLFEVLKFFQFLMLFENQFLDTSSNFGAPFSAVLVNRYVCNRCGYSEEWIDPSDLSQLKKKYEEV